MIEPEVSPVRIAAGRPADLVVRLTNTGPGSCTNVNFGLRLPAALVRLRGRTRMRWPVIPSGESVSEAIQVTAEDPGQYPVVSSSFSYLDHRGVPCHPPSFRAEVSVTPAERRPEPGPPQATLAPVESASAPLGRADLDRVKILFLAANPRGTYQLRIDQEIRGITEEIDRSKDRENIEIVTRWAVRGRDVTRELMNTEPHFVHFAGHGGGGDESFVAENEAGEPEVLRVRGLVGAFKAVDGDIRCVVVNACSTRQLADGLKKALPRAHVIGMRRPVGDDAAIDFAIGFYQAIGAGKDIKQSFELGLALMEMRSGDEDDEDPPFLL